MTQEAKHTPTPWHIEYSENQGDELISIEAFDSDGDAYHITLMRKESEVDEVNAAFILKAVNNYDHLKESNAALLEALKDMRSRFYSCISDGNGELEGDKEAIDKADATIKKAEAI